MPHLVNLSHEDVDAEYNLKGYNAYDRAGHKLGDIDSVIADGDTMEPRYLVVDAGGWLTHKQFVVPIGDVQEIDDDQRRVYFQTLTKQTLESGRYPKYDQRWWDTNEHESFAAHERELGRVYHPEHGHGEEVDYSSDLYQRPAQGTGRLQLMEERLKVNEERYQAGVVRLGKRITEHTETVTVPVREEQVVIERRPGSGEVVGDDLREGETIEVPVMMERITVEKEPVVTEVVVVRTEATERQEQVQETVRREELAVDDQSGLVAEAGRDSGAQATRRESRPARAQTADHAQHHDPERDRRSDQPR